MVVSISDECQITIGKRQNFVLLLANVNNLTRTLKDDISDLYCLELFTITHRNKISNIILSEDINRKINHVYHGKYLSGKNYLL